jgi:hypothetical protein
MHSLLLLGYSVDELIQFLSILGSLHGTGCAHECAVIKLLIISSEEPHFLITAAVLLLTVTARMVQRLLHVRSFSRHVTLLWESAQSQWQLCFHCLQAVEMPITSCSNSNKVISHV